MEFEEAPSHAEAQENEKNLSEYAEDAEHAVMNMIQDHMVENLNDPDIWHLVNDFMDRMVRLLSHLEDLHEDTKAHALGEDQDEHGEHGEHGEGDHEGHDGSMLDQLRDRVDDGDEHHHGDGYGDEYGEEGYGEEDYDQGDGYNHDQHDHDNAQYDYDNYNDEHGHNQGHGQNNGHNHHC